MRSVTGLWNFTFITQKQTNISMEKGGGAGDVYSLASQTLRFHDEWMT